jgi:hypothetical protein
VLFRSVDARALAAVATLPRHLGELGPAVRAVLPGPSTAPAPVKGGPR